MFAAEEYLAEGRSTPILIDLMSVADLRGELRAATELLDAERRQCKVLQDTITEMLEGADRLRRELARRDADASAMKRSPFLKRVWQSTFPCT